MLNEYFLWYKTTTLPWEHCLGHLLSSYMCVFKLNLCKWNNKTESPSLEELKQGRASNSRLNLLYLTLSSVQKGFLGDNVILPWRSLQVLDIWSYKNSLGALNGHPWPSCTGNKRNKLTRVHRDQWPLGRIRSVPGNSTAPFTISPMMHPTDHMSTANKSEMNINKNTEIDQYISKTSRPLTP